MKLFNALRYDLFSNSLILLSVISFISHANKRGTALSSLCPSCSMLCKSIVAMTTEETQDVNQTVQQRMARVAIVMMPPSVVASSLARPPAQRRALVARSPSQTSHARRSAALPSRWAPLPTPPKAKGHHRQCQVHLQLLADRLRLHQRAADPLSMETCPAPPAPRPARALPCRPQALPLPHPACRSTRCAFRCCRRCLVVRAARRALAVALPMQPTTLRRPLLSAVPVAQRCELELELESFPSKLCVSCLTLRLHLPLDLTLADRDSHRDGV